MHTSQYEKKKLSNSSERDGEVTTNESLYGDARHLFDLKQASQNGNSHDETSNKSDTKVILQDDVIVHIFKKLGNVHQSNLAFIQNNL